jgi:murein DD-endopeptidase MepM/ murein hydrolase activator NlpD
MGKQSNSVDMLSFMMYYLLAIGSDFFLKRPVNLMTIDVFVMKGNRLRSIYRAGLFFLCILAACNQSESKSFLPGTAVTTSPVVPRPTAAVISETLVSTPASGVYFTPTPDEVHSLPTPTSQPAFQACSPLAGHTWNDLREIVTNPFDPPPPGKDSGHHGVDFAYYRRGERLSIEGVPVQSVFPGKVAAVIHNRPPYGNMVIVETPGSALADFLGMIPGESVYMLYAHLKADPLVNLGQDVICGEELGEVGNTPPGWSGNPHLHLEERIGPSGHEFPSMAYYDNSITLEEKSNYELWRTSGTFRMLDPLHLLEHVLSSAK